MAIVKQRCPKCDGVVYWDYCDTDVLICGWCGYLWFADDDTDDDICNADDGIIDDEDARD